MKIGVIAPSAVISRYDLAVGLELLRARGFSVQAHSQCVQRSGFFAGSDEARARAFFEYAKDPSISVLWCARGGYGAARILKHLDRLAREKGTPPRSKLLVGLSDITALFEYVSRRWGWSVLHAPMPASPQLWTLGKSEWSSLQSWVRGGRPKAPRPFGVSRLKFLGRPPRSGVEAPLVGGNLSVWTSLVGTRHAMSASGKILFIEEIDEAVYRMDRLIRQVEASGGLKNVRAVVLGDFQNCGDAVRRALKKKPKLSELSRVLKTKPSNFYAPIRPLMTEKKSLQEVFGFLSEELGIPVAYGLPVGHGPGWALPIGARYALKPTGELSLLSWKWLRER